MRAQDHATAAIGSTLVGGTTYLGLLFALRKKKLSRLAKHLIAGSAGLAAAGTTYGVTGYLSNKYTETADQMRENIKKAGLPLEVIEDNGELLLRTTEDYKYKIGGIERVIPKGFVSDGVSAPVVFRSIIGTATDPRTLRGGLEHDYEYRIADGKVSRSQADKHFVDRIKQGGMSPGLANAMGLTLSLTGWAPYYVRKLKNKN